MSELENVVRANIIWFQLYKYLAGTDERISYQRDNRERKVGDFLIIECGVSTWRNKTEQSENAQQKLSPGPCRTNATGWVKWQCSHDIYFFTA